MNSHSQLPLVLVDLLNHTKRSIKHMIPPLLLPYALRVKSWMFHLFCCISRAFREDYSPLVLPWFEFNDRSTCMNRIHWLALLWDSHMSRSRIAVLTIFWPLISTIHAVRSIRTYAPTGYVARQFQVSRWRQLSDQIRLMKRYNITPSSYYKFKLFLNENRMKALQFLQHHEICTLLPGLNKNLDTQELDNKLRFSENVRRYGFPTPAVIAVFERGTMQWYEGKSGQLPRADLVFKPSNLWCGIGVKRWYYDSETDQWSHNHQKLNEEKLIFECRSLSQDNQYILQYCVLNHRDIQPLAGIGVCTVRAVTYRQWQGTPHLLLACFRMPTANSFVDNFAAGGIASPIHPVDGTLGPAVGKDIRVGVLHFHPDNGGPITGRHLPYWKETIKLSIAAHSRFPAFAFVGWDIVITDTGPVLLEANLTWCVDLCQMPHGTPLGETAFPEVYLEHWMLNHGPKAEAVE
jgi:Sugar-transfer associated ATP-grasp